MYRSWKQSSSTFNIKNSLDAIWSQITSGTFWWSLHSDREQDVCTAPWLYRYPLGNNPKSQYTKSQITCPYESTWQLLETSRSSWAATSSLNDDDLYNKEQDTWSNLIRRSTIDEREAIFDRMGLNKMHPKDRRMKLVYQSHAFLWSEFLGNRRRPPPPHVQWRPSVNLIAAIRTIMIPGHLTVLN